MKIIKKLGWFDTMNYMEGNYSFKKYSIKGIVEENGYYQDCTVHIDLQFYNDKKIYIAPKINCTRRLDRDNERGEYYENYIQKQFHKYMDDISLQAWDIGANLSDCYDTHIRNFLLKLDYTNMGSWTECITACDNACREQNQSKG